MKRIKYHINLNILIPLIFTGISILSLIGTYQITAGSIESHSDPIRLLWGWGLGIGITTFACSAVIVWLLLRPVKRFVKETQELHVLPKSHPDNGFEQALDDMGYFAKVFEQVSHLLSTVEARELFPNIIGQSASMRALFAQILKVAPTDSTVLITGESGTGKELVATSIYEHSLRKDKPFIKLNCVAIPEGLLESELFGYEKGAFTGATTRKPGKFEAANGGTIFLDEIGDIPLIAQGKLLRVLQERELDPVGSTRSIKIDVRIIAATNKNLLGMVREGRFREDLFFRLNVVSIHLPPLRERKEDIPALADHFLSTLPNPVRLSPAAMEQLMAYSWPGNIRELHNTLERASVMAEELIDPSLLPSTIRTVVPKEEMHQGHPNGNYCLDDHLRDLEKDIILDALRKAKGIQVAAAAILGISPRSLLHRIKKLNIDVLPFKKMQKM